MEKTTCIHIELNHTIRGSSRSWSCRRRGRTFNYSNPLYGRSIHSEFSKIVLCGSRSKDVHYRSFGFNRCEFKGQFDNQTSTTASTETMRWFFFLLWRRCDATICYFMWRNVNLNVTFSLLLLVFSVTPFKIDQNKNQNRSTNKSQNLGNERRYIYKDSRQDSGQRKISYTRYPNKCFTQTYRDLYGDAMLVLTYMSGRTETNRNIFIRILLQKRDIFFEKLINIKVIPFLIHEMFR